MNKDEIIKWLISTHFVENYIKKLEYKSVDFINDIIQEIYLMILEINDDKIAEIYQQGQAAFLRYISGLIYRQVCSKNSYIYKKFKEQFKYEQRMSATEWQIFNDTNKWQKNYEHCWETKEN